MNDPLDPHSPDPGPAGAQPGATDAGQPRKPRIEVLQRGPAAPASGPARSSDGTGFAGAAPNPPQHPEAYHEPRRGGLFRSRTSLLMLLAAIVIAGFLLYTYLSSERGAEYPDKGPELSSADADLLGNPEADSDETTTREPVEPSAAETTDDRVAPEPEPAASPALERAPARAAAPEARPPAEAVRSEEPAAARPEPEDDNAGASAAQTVRAFYAALSAGDGRSAAQFVIPAKRRSGPLSAGELSRYYSSFRRPLRVRSLTALDANTVRVAYDYVLADGRACRGQAAVNVVQRDGRSLVSGIRTRGPC